MQHQRSNPQHRNPDRGSSDHTGLYGVIKKDSVWHRGIFIINTHLVTGDELSVINFVNRLTDVINAEGVKELDLDGALKVSIDEEPYEFRVAVREGKVTYQPA